MSRAFLGPAAARQARQIFLSGSVAWIESQRPSNVLQRFVAPPGLCKRTAQIAVRHG